jgi:hypothetical protein
MLTLTVCCLGWGPWHAQTRAIDTGGNTDPSGNLSFTKRALVGWMSGSWTQRDEIALAQGLHDWGMRAVPVFSYTLAFVLQLRKSTENLSQGRPEFHTGIYLYIPGVANYISFWSRNLGSNARHEPCLIHVLRDRSQFSVQHILVSLCTHQWNSLIEVPLGFDRRAP